MHDICLFLSQSQFFLLRWVPMSTDQMRQQTGEVQFLHALLNSTCDANSEARRRQRARWGKRKKKNRQLRRLRALPVLIASHATRTELDLELFFFSYRLPVPHRATRPQKVSYSLVIGRLHSEALNNKALFVSICRRFAFVWSGTSPCEKGIGWA